MRKTSKSWGKSKRARRMGEFFPPSPVFFFPRPSIPAHQSIPMLNIVHGGHRDTNITRQLSPAQKYASIADYSLYHKLHSVKRKERCNDRLHKNGLYITSEHFLLICFVLTLRQNRQNTVNNSPKQCH